MEDTQSSRSAEQPADTYTSADDPSLHVRIVCAAVDAHIEAIEKKRETLRKLR